MNKVCRKCGISKDIQHFNRDKSRPDGHKSQCRECGGSEQGVHGEQGG